MKQDATIVFNTPFFPLTFFLPPSLPPSAFAAPRRGTSSLCCHPLLRPSTGSQLPTGRWHCWARYSEGCWRSNREGWGSLVKVEGLKKPNREHRPILCWQARTQASRQVL